MRLPNFMAALVTVIDANQFVRKPQLFERFLRVVVKKVNHLVCMMFSAAQTVSRCRPISIPHK
jgi:hypothetical protein